MNLKNLLCKLGIHDWKEFPIAVFNNSAKIYGDRCKRCKAFKINKKSLVGTDGIMIYEDPVLFLAEKLHYTPEQLLKMPVHQFNALLEMQREKPRKSKRGKKHAKF